MSTSNTFVGGESIHLHISTIKTPLGLLPFMINLTGVLGRLISEARSFRPSSGNLLQTLETQLAAIKLWTAGWKEHLKNTSMDILEDLSSYKTYVMLLHGLQLQLERAFPEKEDNPRVIFESFARRLNTTFGQFMIPVIEHLARQSTFLGEELAETDEMITHERMQTLGLETETILELLDFQRILIQSLENPSGISISPREKPGIGDTRSKIRPRNLPLRFKSPTMPEETMGEAEMGMTVDHHLLHGIQFYFGRTYLVFSLKQLFYPPVTLKDFVHFEDHTNSQGSIVVYRTKSRRESDLVRDGWKPSISSLRPPFSSFKPEHPVVPGIADSKDIISIGEGDVTYFTAVQSFEFRKVTFCNDTYHQLVDKRLVWDFCRALSDLYDIRGALKSVFQKWGHIFATEVVLGGQRLLCTQAYNVDTTAASLIAKVLRETLGKRSKVPHAMGSQKAFNEAMANIFSLYIGGNILFQNDLTVKEWEQSLQIEQNWHVICVDKTISILELLPDSLRKSILDMAPIPLLGRWLTEEHVRAIRCSDFTVYEPVLSREDRENGWRYLGHSLDESRALIVKAADDDDAIIEVENTVWVEINDFCKFSRPITNDSGDVLGDYFLSTTTFDVSEAEDQKYTKHPERAEDPGSIEDPDSSVDPESSDDSEYKPMEGMCGLRSDLLSLATYEKVRDTGTMGSVWSTKPLKTEGNPPIIDLQLLRATKNRKVPEETSFRGLRSDCIKIVNPHCVMPWINIRDIPLPILDKRVNNISVRAVAEGGYSNVWQGTLDEKQLVAIKCIRDQPVQEEKARRRLRREIGTWWCLQHENIAPLLGIIYNDKFGISPAMISPWYKNGAASAYLNPKNCISLSQRVKLFNGVARGIHYLHTFDVAGASTTHPQHGIKLVHGDLKPPNVLVDDDGRAKLCDFGLLRLVRDSAPTGMTTASSHTGTTRYLSFELVSDDLRPTTASDVWALACIGWEFTYSKPPYANILDISPNASFKIMSAIKKGRSPATRPSNGTDTISGLWSLFEECWDQDPSKRPEAVAICKFLDDNEEKLIAELEDESMADLEHLS